MKLSYPNVGIENLAYQIKTLYNGYTIIYNRQL